MKAKDFLRAKRPLKQVFTEVFGVEPSDRALFCAVIAAGDILRHERVRKARAAA